jgi:hypothetical protein
MKLYIKPFDHLVSMSMVYLYITIVYAYIKGIRIPKRKMSSQNSGIILG